MASSRHARYRLFSHLFAQDDSQGSLLKGQSDWAWCNDGFGSMVILEVLLGARQEWMLELELSRELVASFVVPKVCVVSYLQIHRLILLSHPTGTSLRLVSKPNTARWKIGRHILIGETGIRGKVDSSLILLPAISANGFGALDSQHYCERPVKFCVSFSHHCSSVLSCRQPLLSWLLNIGFGTIPIVCA